MEVRMDHSPPTLAREGVVFGACLAITLFGLAAITASLFEVELIPHSTLGAVGLLLAVMLAGSVVGVLIDARRDHS